MAYIHQAVMINVASRSKSNYQEHTCSPQTPSESSPSSSSGEAEKTGCHGWSPHSEDACHGHHHGPSQARRLGLLDEQRQGRVLLLIPLRDGRVRGSTTGTLQLIPLREPKRCGAMVIRELNTGSCTTCKTLWVAYHPAYLASPSLPVGTMPTS
jgi:hypothetical protein